MSTRAIRWLTAANIPFEIIRYDHLRKGAEYAALATGFPLERTVKTLVLAAGPGRYLLALLPGDRQADLRRLAALLAAKRVEMADSAAAERLSGYRVGGISPFGFKQKLPVVMDSSLLAHESILINAGRRGTMLRMAPRVLQEALGCRAGAIGEPISPTAH